MNGGIYEIRNQINGKCYIGSAVDLRKRWRNHLNSLRKGQHRNGHLQAAFNKYEELAFVFSILEYAGCAILIEREQYFFDTLRPEYNIALIAGSPMLGRRHAAESRRKMSQATRGERNSNYGKSPSKETRRKLSEALMGRQFSDSHRSKISRALQGNTNTLGHKHTKETLATMSRIKRGELNPNYGKHPSEETRAKLSEAMSGERNPFYGKHHSVETRTKISAGWTPERRQAQRDRMRGKPLDQEHRRKISEAHKGKCLSKETRAKISAALMGHPVSADTRAKISASHRARAS